MAAVQGHEYGPTGKAATGGASIGVALVDLIPHLEPVEVALNILVAAALAAVGAAVAASASVRRQREEAAAAWDADAAGAPKPVTASPVDQAQEQSDPVLTASQLDELKRLLATSQEVTAAEPAPASPESDEAPAQSAAVQRLDAEALEQLRQKLV